jgi:hypothetical protein
MDFFYIWTKYIFIDANQNKIKKCVFFLWSSRFHFLFRKIPFLNQHNKRFFIFFFMFMIMSNKFVSLELRKQKECLIFFSFCKASLKWSIDEEKISNEPLSGVVMPFTNIQLWISHFTEKKHHLKNGVFSTAFTYYSDLLIYGMVVSNNFHLQEMTL